MARAAGEVEDAGAADMRGDGGAEVGGLDARGGELLDEVVLFADGVILRLGVGHCATCKIPGEKCGPRLAYGLGLAVEV